MSSITILLCAGMQNASMRSCLKIPLLGQGHERLTRQSHPARLSIQHHLVLDRMFVAKIHGYYVNFVG